MNDEPVERVRIPTPNDMHAGQHLVPPALLRVPDAAGSGS